MAEEDERPESRSFWEMLEEAEAHLIENQRLVNNPDDLSAEDLEHLASALETTKETIEICKHCLGLT